MADVKEGSEVSELQEVLKILQLIFHRNKNQHRLTKWWKWLSILKRSVTKLVQELTGKESEAIRTRIRYMTEFVVPKCHLAFTNLIADQQFAAMGLVLLANLARIRRLVSRMAPREPGQRQVRAVPEVRVVVEDDEDLGEFVTRSARGNEALSMPLGLEHGPAVAKTSEPGKEGAENSSPAEARSPIVSSPALASKPTKKERRKRSGAIDELFDTII